MARGAGVLVLIVVAFALAPAAAHAASCATPADGADEPPPWPVSFEAVALSGPRVQGLLFTPARLHVLRYLTGSGPRVVLLDNGVSRSSSPSDFAASFRSDFAASAGGIYRVYPFLWGGRTWIRRGELVPTSLCYGTGAIRRPPSLRPVRGRLRAALAPGGVRWHARLIRGPHGLRCVGTRRVDRVGSIRRECERMTRPASAVYGIRTAGSGQRASTLVFAQAPRLRAVTVKAPGGVRTLPAAPGLRIALTAYPGALAPETVRLALRFAGGAVRHVSLKDR